MRELRELRQRIDDLPVPAPPSEGALPTVIILKDPAQSATSLKPTSFPTYDGDQATYPAWRRAVLSALKIDWNTFKYTDSRVFLMIYKALEGKAQRQAASFFESGGRGGHERPEDFIEFLDRGNWDQTRGSRARSELNDMRMGPKQKWSQFYCQWANKLTEASGDNWPDDVKVSLLRTALNQTLKITLAGNHLIPDNDFAEFVRIVSKIAQQHEEIYKPFGSNQRIGHLRADADRNILEASRSSENEVRTQGWGRSGIEKGQVGRTDGAGDTYMGGINSVNVPRGLNGKRLRAKWKTPEQIRKLKEEGRCYRCERRGCSTKVCKILPAVNPNPNKKDRVSIANIEPLNLDIFDVEDMDDIDTSQNKLVSEN